MTSRVLSAAVAALLAMGLGAECATARMVPPRGSTALICGPWSSGGAEERSHVVARGATSFERSHGLNWFWTIRPTACQLVLKHGSPEVHADFDYVTGLRWSVWTARQAVASSTLVYQGEKEVTITLSRPRTACGHRVFTLVTFGRRGSMRLNNWCVGC